MLRRFPACSPSLAISLFEENDSRTIQDKAKLVSDIQSTKNNYFVLCVFPNMDSSHWYDFQNLIEPGTARIIKLNTFTEVVDAIITCHANMSDSYKLHLQSEYFANKRKEFQSSSTVKAILLTVASKLGISEDEIVIVLEAFPTISRIIRASKEELMNTCPIDNTSIDKLFHYFHGQNDS